MKSPFGKIGPILLSAVMLLMSGCSSNSPSFDINTENVDVVIPGMKDEVRLVFLSDLHITVVSDQVDGSERKNVSLRRQIFSNGGIVSEYQCPEWMQVINDTQADCALFGGDMIDFASDENMEVLKSGLDMLDIPFMYIRADHDIEPYYLTDPNAQRCVMLQKEICEYEDVMVRQFPDFVIIGWNNSPYRLTQKGWETIEDALSGGKPAILLTHVPIEPLSDKSLEEACRRNFAGQSLLWGYGDDYYKPDETSSKLLDLIYADDTPFVEILAAHMHFSWDGMVSDKVHEHVFAPSFSGNMGMITVSGSRKDHSPL